MNEQEALAAVLTEWFKDYIQYLNRSEIAALCDLVYAAQREINGSAELDNDADLAQFRALEDLLTSGKWKVVYREDTP